MPRHANVDWNLPEGTPNGRGSNIHSFESIHAALLMDIRDELQKLNRLLHCTNFTGIPTTLRSIAKNTTRRRRKPALRISKSA